MTDSELKEKIRNYLYEIGAVIEKEPVIPKLDFVFHCKYPNAKGRTIIVLKEKNKSCFSSLFFLI